MAVPDAMIVRMIVTVAGTDRAFHRLKNLGLHFKRDAHAGEQLPHRRVVADANLARSDLHWHVEVANLPAGLGRLGGVARQADGQHRFGRLPDAIAMRRRLKKNRAMAKRLGQLETEIRAERQMDGIKKAKDRGVQFGKRPALSEDQIVELRKKRTAGMLIKDLMAHYSLSKATIYRYLGANEP